MCVVTFFFFLIWVESSIECSLSLPFRNNSFALRLLALYRGMVFQCSLGCSAIQKIPTPRSCTSALSPLSWSSQERVLISYPADHYAPSY
ncbi:hypothetical protein ASPBRDRAFT_48678 [Aspergillus brasiliensis CBS 101740]|uniref:Secreted protein n=1 Tax=Aspergillus brasiliensis (strain CBS 101740 / IMI 381727 / IBT 21946) TaxID=767769 RepID=A0A1L9U4Y4_ASPBC|nr:hypothetical protein ASPBRDRAFT_48678 [Aspergillus brasiliensis CBS 101740]